MQGVRWTKVKDRETKGFEGEIIHTSVCNQLAINTWRHLHWLLIAKGKHVSFWREIFSVLFIPPRTIADVNTRNIKCLEGYAR